MKLQCDICNEFFETDHGGHYVKHIELYVNLENDPNNKVISDFDVCKKEEAHYYINKNICMCEGCVALYMKKVEKLTAKELTV